MNEEVLEKCRSEVGLFVLFLINLEAHAAGVFSGYGGTGSLVGLGNMMQNFQRVNKELW